MTDITLQYSIHVVVLYIPGSAHRRADWGGSREAGQRWEGSQRWNILGECSTLLNMGLATVMGLFFATG